MILTNTWDAKLPAWVMASLAMARASALWAAGTPSSRSRVKASGTRRQALEPSEPSSRRTAKGREAVMGTRRLDRRTRSFFGI